MIYYAACIPAYPATCNNYIFNLICCVASIPPLPKRSDFLCTHTSSLFVDQYQLNDKAFIVYVPAWQPDKIKGVHAIWKSFSPEHKSQLWSTSWALRLECVSCFSIDSKQSKQWQECPVLFQRSSRHLAQPHYHILGLLNAWFYHPQWIFKMAAMYIRMSELSVGPGV